MFKKISRKRYRLFGKPTGVIAVSDKSKVEGLIICALQLAIANNGKATRNARRSINGGSIVSTSTTVITNNADIHLNPEYDNDDNNILFCHAAANAFDHSPTVREYFHNNRSRINPDNKSLWPLRYHAYKEYDVW
jgi:hypothetical protein